MNDAALVLEGVTKRFGPTLALDGAHCVVRRGTVHALLGENGAGKSTLMKVAFGLVRADAGRMTLEGRDTVVRSPADAIAAGVGMVQQHFSLVGAMTVAENVALGGRGRFDPAAAAARVRALGEQTGLQLNPTARVDTLGVGAQQRLEIVKALAHDCRLLILDEPSAVLAPSEAAELMRWLRAFADGGRTAVLITHKLREALTLADDVTVLRRGRTVLTAPAATLDQDAVVEAMVGEAVAENVRDRAPRPSPDDAPVVLACHDVWVTDARGVATVRGVTLQVRGGEIVGFAGVEGAGQHDTLRVLAGRLTPSRGTVTRPAALGWVPEDRLRDALIGEFTLTENLALEGLGEAQGAMPWGDLRSRTDALLAAHDVRAPGAGARAAGLSGGNQQKFVLARALDGDAAALVVENPTRGLDIRATAQVMARLRAARDEGLAVVVYSSDLDEVLALADRVVVFSAGTARETGVEREIVARAMVGGDGGFGDEGGGTS